MCWLLPGQRGDVGAGGEVLHHARCDEDDRADHRDRQQQPQADPGQVDPEVAQPPLPVRAKPRTSANATRRCRPRRRRSSAPPARPSAPGSPSSTHPSTTASSCSSRSSPRCSTPGPVRRRKTQAEPQMVLQPKKPVEKQDRDRRERQHAARVHTPGLLALRISPRQADTQTAPAPGPAVRSPPRRAGHPTAGVPRQELRPGTSQTRHQRATPTLEPLRKQQRQDQKHGQQHRDHKAHSVLGAHRRCPARTVSVKITNASTVTKTMIKSATSDPYSGQHACYLTSVPGKPPSRIYASHTRSGPILTASLRMSPPA